ncbi:MAG: hypothetical protein GXP56_17215 [Deltaproteobacteria bacterium]|nr:hypothetical protein [Deltaproteobacteria bacterium]
MARDVKEKLFEIDSKKIELDFLQQQFLVECKRFAARSIEGKVRFAISSNPEKTMALGKAGLTPIKSHVNKMIDNVSDLVEKIINRPELWRHTEQSLSAENFPIDQYLAKKNKGPGIFEKPVKKILSPVGELLISHGLDTDKNWEKNEGTVMYRLPLAWSPEMKDCMDQYNERFNELSKLVYEYESLLTQSSGIDALDLWDSI